MSPFNAELARIYVDLLMFVYETLGGLDTGPSHMISKISSNFSIHDIHLLMLGHDMPYLVDCATVTNGRLSFEVTQEEQMNSGFESGWKLGVQLHKPASDEEAILTNHNMAEGSGN